MHLVAAWAEARQGPPVHVACVDHGLRVESATEAENVVQAAERLRLPARILPWSGPKPATAIQERARAARYALLADHGRAIGATHLVTAHTLDDQAETVLFRLARGSGLAGLGGMARETRRGDLVHLRPLLGVRKQALVDLCRRNNWALIDDPSNHDEAYARTRWRRLMPLLAAEGLTPECLARFAGRVRRGDEALSALADSADRETLLEAAPEGLTYDFPALSRQPDELVVRVVANALTRLADGPGPRLGRLETLVAELQHCVAAGLPLRRTLNGCRVVLSAEGGLSFAREADRHRGQRQRMLIASDA
jgi:tRNA(Ile)-lysidine synthase